MLTDEFLESWNRSKSSLLEKTTDLVQMLIQNHIDLAGKPYFEHLKRVSERGSSLELKLVGLLHDILEDTLCTKEDLIVLGYSNEIISAIELLTKNNNDDYDQYIMRIYHSNCLLAIQVKLYDLEDNMNLERISHPSMKDQERVQKYQRAYQKLNEKRKELIEC